MKFLFSFFLLAFSLSGVFANIDTLIVKSVYQADSLRGIDQADKALDLLLKTRRNKDFGKASCETKGILYHKIGVCHYSLDLYQTALKYWRDSSLQIRLLCLGNRNKETANSYYAIAMAYRYLGDRKNESKNVKQALEILESLPDKDLSALANNYLQAGSLFDDLEDYGQALHYYDQSERFYRGIKSLETEDLKNLAEVKKLQGLTKSRLGRSREGILDLFSAIEMFEKIDKEDRERNLAHCYNNLSIAYTQLLDYPNAEKYGQLALKFNKKLNNSKEISINYESLGIIKKRQKKHIEALSLFRQSLAIRETLKDKKLISNSWENIGDVYAEQQNFEQALKYYETAVSYLVPGQKRPFSTPAIIKAQSIVDRPGLLRIIGLQANCWLKRKDGPSNKYNLEKAFSFYRAYDTLHIQVRQQFKETGSKYWLMQKALPVYEQAIEVALQLHKQTNQVDYLQDAYLFSAKCKAAVLLEGLQELDAKLKGVPNEILEKERAAKETYVQIERQFFETLQNGEGVGLDSLRTKLFSARRGYDKLIDEFELKYPSYYQLKYALPNAADISFLKKKLPIDAVVLEYFIGARNVYVFKISKSGIKCYVSPAMKNFNELCLNFIKITNGSIPFSPDVYSQAGNALFEVLLKKPLAEMGSKTKRIIIIPDNLLLQLSFDVLPYRVIQTGETNMPYLIKKYAASIAYSNQLIFSKNTKPKTQRAIKHYGGFGLEYDDFTLEGFKSLKIDADSIVKKRSAGRLPNSDDEVAEIAKMLDGAAWLNQQATKNVFLKNAGRYGILHLAMHGIVDEKDPLNSALVFSREKKYSEDFILRAAEIYGLSLNAEMAVLSACNTGNGELTPEGVRSLARAFTHAGCPSLVASLWYAYDGPTREILVSFFRHIKEGKPKDVALQMAKLDYLGKASPTYIMPEYWSNLTVVGDPSPLSSNTANSSVFFRFAALFAGLIGLFFIRNFYEK